MVYTLMTKKAMQIAYEAHHGQVDKAGVPYVFHPFHLAEQMDDELSCTVALLHDVAEDSDITLDALSREFPPQVIDALRLLTHDKATDYFTYIRAIRTNPIAVTVKLADLSHNSDCSRCTGCDISPEKLAQLQQKYAHAKAILEGREK